MNKIIFAKRLKQLRKKENLTQLEISKQIGCGKRTYEYYESTNCNTMPLAEKLYKLSKLLNASIDYMFGLTDNPTIR